MASGPRTYRAEVAIVPDDKWSVPGDRRLDSRMSLSPRRSPSTHRLSSLNPFSQLFPTLRRSCLSARYAPRVESASFLFYWPNEAPPRRCRRAIRKARVSGPKKEEELRSWRILDPANLSSSEETCYSVAGEGISTTVKLSNRVIVYRDYSTYESIIFELAFCKRTRHF